MARKLGLKNWRFGLAVLVLAECATFGAPAIAPVTPAAAQFFDQRYPSLSRQRPRSGGFFDSLFGGGRSSGEREVPNPYQHQYQLQREAPSETSRAPAARKDTKPDQGEPTTNIVVLGDSMADWLAYGLEDAFGDAPEIGIVRKNKPFSGLLRYDSKNDLDWWHVARDLLANEKASYVVMMIGVGDRQNMREKDVAKEAEQQKADAAKTAQTTSDQAKTDAAKTDAAKADPAKSPDAAKADPNKPDDGKADDRTDEAKTDAEQAIVAPEPKRTAKRAGNGVIEFRTDEWAKVYSHRIDETIAALKSKGVPVFWVGLPSIRGTKSTADVSYLNDLYRARAEKAGAVYVDVWDGFVDEGGKFTTFGPDYEGQMRRLRSADGVYFTKYGARKLAHYVEREIRRTMANRGPIALPMGPTPAMPADGKSAVRPLAGPVVPLTTISGNNDELAGGNVAQARADASAAAVLVKGDPIAPAPGRADDFIWPPGSERPKVEAPVAKPAAAAKPQAAITPPAAPVATPAVAPPVAVAPAPPPVAAKPPNAPQAIMTPEPAAAAKPEPKQETKPEAKPRAAEARPQPRHPQAADPRAPRPPQGIAQQPPRRRDEGGLFGLFR
ncbi:MAG: DUF459 domain-containing protein [Proteobacteria bacterium]|nr:DUF459 domain-containing protein [Pseudomonadota bacterium]